MINPRWPALAFMATQAALLWITSDVSLTPMVAMLLATASLAPFCRITAPNWVWWAASLAGIVGVLIKCGLFYYSLEIKTWVLPALWTLCLSECLLIVQAVLMLRREPSGQLPPFFYALGLLAFAGVYNRTIDHDQHAAYLIGALLATMLAMLLSGVAANGSRETRWQSRLPRLLVLGAVVVATLIVGWQTSRYMSRNVAFLRPWSLDLGLRNRRVLSGAYVRDATLDSITVAKSDNPSGVALRVVSARPPGYLRGRVFDSYRDAHWFNSQRHLRDGSSGSVTRRLTPQPDNRMMGRPQPGQGRQTFVLDDSARGPWTSYEVSNDPQRGRVYFTPLGASLVEGEGSDLRTDHHDVVMGGVDRRVPYVAFVGRERTRQPLTTYERQFLLAFPIGIDPSVTTIAREVCRDGTTAREKIDAVQDFFQQNFRYAVGQLTVPPGEEPLSYFLLNRPPAHCEYFASGAIALLRAEGVPCRYATGYVVDEPDEYGDYWIARNRNAHAWVEAFDDEQSRWVIVEATPGMVAPEDTLGDDQNLAGANSRANISSAFGINAGMFDGHWAWGIWQTPTVLLVLAALCGCMVYLRPAWRARILAALGLAPDARSQYRRQLARMDRRLWLRRMRRRPDETLHQFAARVQESADQDPWLRRVAEWYLAYAALRYANRDGPTAVSDLPPMPKR